MKKAFWMLLLCITSCSAIGAVQTNNVFYPLPTQSQGKIITAKNLFLAEKGGIWLQDVRNQVLFFDGYTILPESGSAIEYDSEHITYLDNAFWTFFHNEVYRTVANQERELVFSLTPGSEILNIGTSRRYIWVTDAEYFYTYNIDSREFRQYSLMEMYQFNPAFNIRINDAEFILSKWVLATNAGVYLSAESEFEHVTGSGSNYIEEIYFSERRREVIVGTLAGALVFNIEQPNALVKRVAENHVLSITETPHEYWIGTEKGLFVYSHTSQKAHRLDRDWYRAGSNSGNKIYALLNDNAGGVWIGTDRGVLYFSQYSETFQRVKLSSGEIARMQSLKSASVSPTGEGFLLLNDSGLMRLGKNSSTPLWVVNDKVEDYAEHNGIVYLATHQGVKTIDFNTGEELKSQLPHTIKHSTNQYIHISRNEELWGASDKHLWSYNIKEGKVTQFGSDWMIDKYLPAKLKQLQSLSSNTVMLGTEHGVYLLRAGQVNFVPTSSLYGEVIDIKEVSPDKVWVAARYGLYQVHLADNQVEPINMENDHVTPLCILSNSDGVWLASSTGLSQFDQHGRLLQHYGEPFGLLNNELSPRLCSLDPSSEKKLIIGSDQALIAVHTQQLAVSPLPKVQLILSQIKLNQELYSLGNSIETPLRAGYSDSITFRFGMLPNVSNLSLEYRIEDNEEWQGFEGSTLTLDHLLPGNYQLHVRALRASNDRSKHVVYPFSVAKPWFLSGWFILLSLCALGVVMAVGVYWRSYLITQTNRQLKAQVLLKTDQLRHQGRVLLANNHQLRKQLQVRRLIFAQSIEGVKEQLEQNAQAQNLSARSVMNQFSTKLEQLLNVRSTDDDSIATYNLAGIVESALSGWQEEFRKAGVTVEYKSVGPAPIYMRYFNLDELLTILFDSTIKRSYRSQLVKLSITLVDDRYSLAVVDEGESLESSELENSTLAILTKLVEQSGGWLKTHSSSERNLIEFDWLVSSPEENSPNENQSFRACEDNSDEPWINKVIDLVAANYSDPEFSTALAAKKLFVSERSLQRRFKKSTDKTFVEYLTEVRLDSACEQLLAGEKVSDVAFQCGFNDPSYFSQRFKHRFGMPPTQFVEGRTSY